MPTIDPATFALEIRGRVANPRRYMLDERKQPSCAEPTCAFECGGNRPPGIMNRMVGNARWTGTSLEGLIDEAKPLPDSREVIPCVRHEPSSRTDVPGPRDEPGVLDDRRSRSAQVP